jgi:hypothetical protein
MAASKRRCGRFYRGLSTKRPTINDTAIKRGRQRYQRSKQWEVIVMSAAFPEATADVEKARQALRPAETFFLAHLATIVGDMTGLTAGDEDFDYFIPVPVSQLHELSPQISDLQLEVQERFGIGLSAMPIPYATYHERH